MTRITFENFTEIMRALGATYANRVRVDDALLDAYWALLSGYTHDQIVRAVSAYCRDPRGLDFFPTAPDLVAHADRLVQDQIRRQQTEALHDDRETAAKLLSGPIDTWGEAHSLPALAVALVRDLMDGTVMPGSDVHRTRQGEVEALAQSWQAPCCDKDGLTSYQVAKLGGLYPYAARCDCPRGQASLFRGYPIIARMRDQADTTYQSIEAGRDERQQRVADYHARGVARMEPCSDLCQHGTSIPLSPLSGGLQ